MKRKNLKKIVLSSALLLLSQNVFGYTFEYLSNSKPTPTWNESRVKWWYNSANSPYDDEQVLNWIKEASKSWEDESSIHFEYQGLTDTTQFNLTDRKIVFGWGNHNIASTYYSSANPCIGAFVWFSEDDGAMSDARMTLNSAKAQNPTDRYCIDRGKPMVSDWQGMITHELGHVLGLGHHYNDDSTMNDGARTVDMKSLEAYDKEAIQSLYPLKPCSGFLDVKESDSICNDLTFAKDSEWVNGYSDATFKPNREVNRAEFTKIVMNATYKKELESKNCFYDNAIGEYEIKADKWYSSYVCTAKENTIVKGKKDGFFHPEDKVNYAEGIKIILRALGFEAVESDYTDWYTPYINEATAMELPLYAVTHIMTRGEMISLIRDAYRKHTKRALATNSWKQSCHAKNYHFYKLGTTPTCKEKWSMQLFYELGIPNLNTQSSLVRTMMNDVQDTHDIAMSTFKQISAVANLGGSAQDDLVAFQIESIKTLSGVAFDKQGGDIANITGGIFDIGLSIMQEGINELSKTKPSPLMYVSFASDFGKIGTDIWGAYSLNEKTKALNNLNIAIAYLDDFYQYGGDNGKVSVNESKINEDANMYDTIWHYATNKGYKNSWWSDEFDFSKTVDIVEQIKKDVNRAVQICYIDGKCLSQKQKEPLTSFDIFTINGNQSIKN
jgi:hypothetical protein